MAAVDDDVVDVPVDDYDDDDDYVDFLVAFLVVKLHDDAAFDDAVVLYVVVFDVVVLDVVPLVDVLHYLTMYLEFVRNLPNQVFVI